MSEIASPIIRQLEATYSLLRTKHTDLPADIVFVMGQGKTKGGIKWGHFATGRWDATDPTISSNPAIPEVLISAECLAQGGEQVMQTLVHEAVHALAQARGTKETSRQGRYHNKKFVKLAEEMGMTYPHDAPHDTIGWSAVVLTDQTKETYAEEIAKLQEVITVAKGKGLIQEEKPPTKKPRVIAIITPDNGSEPIELPEKTYEKIHHALAPHTVSYEVR